MAPSGDKPSSLVGKKQRCWWEPTDDEDKTDFGGAWWPVEVVGKKGSSRYVVRYDNGEEETVDAVHLSPNDLPVDFGAEKVPLQPGEFCEIHNGSKSDPCAWVGAISGGLQDGSYTVSYPFHDSEDERIAAKRIRRARVMENGSWRLLRPYQTWPDGEVVSPLELETIDESELDEYLAMGKPQPKPKSSSKPAAGGGSKGGSDKGAAAGAGSTGKRSAPAASSSGKRGRDEEPDVEEEDEEEDEDEQQEEELTESADIDEEEDDSEDFEIRPSKSKSKKGGGSGGGGGGYNNSHHGASHHHHTHHSSPAKKVKTGPVGAAKRKPGARSSANTLAAAAAATANKRATALPARFRS